MIYLTETFADHKLNDAIATEWAEHNEDLAQTYFSNIIKKGSAGVAILLRGKLSKAKVTKKLETAPARTVSIEIEIENQKHKFLCVYCPNNEKDRVDLLEKIIEHESTPYPIIWGGDFNYIDDPELDRLSNRRATIPRQVLGRNQVNAFNTVHDCVDSFRHKHKHKHNETIPTNTDQTVRPRQKINKQTKTNKTKLRKTTKNYSNLHRQDSTDYT